MAGENIGSKTIAVAVLVWILLFGAAYFFLGFVPTALMQEGSYVDSNGNLLTASLIPPSQCAAVDGIESEVCEIPRCAENCDDGNPETLDFCRGADFACEHLVIEPRDDSQEPEKAEIVKTLNETDNSTKEEEVIYYPPYTYILFKGSSLEFDYGGVYFTLYKFIEHILVGPVAGDDEYLAARIKIENKNGDMVYFAEPPTLTDARGREIGYTYECGTRDAMEFPLELDAGSSISGYLCYGYPEISVFYPLVLGFEGHESYILVYDTEMYLERNKQEYSSGGGIIRPSSTSSGGSSGGDSDDTGDDGDSGDTGGDSGDDGTSDGGDSDDGDSSGGDSDDGGTDDGDSDGGYISWGGDDDSGSTDADSGDSGSTDDSSSGTDSGSDSGDSGSSDSGDSGSTGDYISWGG